VDRLWAPWRLAYVAAPQPSPSTAEEKCFICQALSARTPHQERECWLVHRSAHSVVILNRFPYNNGHLLICPQRHQGELGGLSDAELLDLQQLLVRFMAILQKRMRPDGFNVGLNLGRAAGAGVPGHLHWHLVPRWQGDTNFMPVIADTRVLVQSLESLYDLLVEELSFPPAPAGQSTDPAQDMGHRQIEIREGDEQRSSFCK
jgi:ATP adenylyltransferase